MCLFYILQNVAEFPKKLSNKLMLNVAKTLREVPTKLLEKICLFLRLTHNTDSTDFGIVITTQPQLAVNEEKQWEQSQQGQGNITEKKTLSKLQKLKCFYKAPVTKFWFNVVRNL